MPSVDPTWKLPVAVVALLVPLSAFVVSGNVLFGVFAAAVLYLVAATVMLVAWITSPVGPVARWLDRVA